VEVDALGGKYFEDLLLPLEGDECSSDRYEAAVQTEGSGLEVLCAKGEEAERDLPCVPLAFPCVEAIFKYVFDYLIHCHHGTTIAVISSSYMS
jgi:hypothetical protein